MPSETSESYLWGHVGESSILSPMSDGDAVGGFLVGLVKAGEGLASVCWLMISGSDLSEDEIKDMRCFRSFTLLPVVSISHGSVLSLAILF